MKIAKKSIICNLMVIISILFLSFSFITPSINPFIFAFVISLVKNDANVYVVLASVFVGLFLNNSTVESLIIGICTVAVLCLLKFILSLKIVKNKSIPSYICLIFSQTAFIYFNLYSKTAIISVIVSVISSNLFLYVYNVILNAIKTKKHNGVYVTDELICGFIMLTSIMLGLCHIHFGEFYLIYPLSLLLIMFSALTLSNYHTLSIACICSLSLALSNNSVLPFAIILIWSIVCVMLVKINKYAMCVGVVLCDILLGCVFNAYITYTYINLLSTIIPAIIIICIPNKQFGQISMFFGKNHQNIAKNYVIDQNFAVTRKKLNSLAFLFNDLSVCYKSLLQATIPSEKLGDFVATEIENGLCGKCGFRCNQNSNVHQKFSELVDIALSKGKITMVDLPSSFNINCPFINQMIALINDAVFEFNSVKTKSEEQNSTLLALTQSCVGVSNLANNLSLNLGGLKIDTNVKEKDIIAEFSVNNLFVKEVMVLKNEKDEYSKVLMVLREIDAGNSRFAQVLSKTLKFNFVATQIENSKIAGWKVVTFEIAPKFNVFLGYSTKSKGEDGGDNMLFSKLDTYNTVLALADGMGTDKKASIKSNLCLDLLLSYLKLGINREIVISSINNILLKADPSTFSTLDIVEFDTSSGRADFIKLASSVSFIKQKDKCTVIEPQSPPLGIVDAISPSTKTAYLGAGEFIVMCTDGVVDSFGIDNLCEYINNERTVNAQILAESIIEEASIRATKLDDMTCCVLKINNF